MAESLTKEFFRAFEETSSERRVLFAAQFGELLQFRTLLGVESRRDFHHHPHEKIASLAPVHVDDAFAAELAIDRGAWLVTADPEFEKVGKALSVYSLPRYEK